jgi:hypothetical protein
MPSTLVHLAVAGLLGAALLRTFDWRAAAVVMGVAVVPDLDTFVGLAIPGAHRAALHTALLPLLLGAVLAYDTVVRERSAVGARWGAHGVRVAWVSVVALAVAGIGIDLFYNGVNLLYPLHDQFYDLSGKLVWSNQRGVVQTMFDVEQARTGTTQTTHYSTGVDPSRGSEPENVERIFPVATSGLQFLVTVTGFGVTAFRVWETHKR